MQQTTPTEGVALYIIALQNMRLIGYGPRGHFSEVLPTGFTQAKLHRRIRRHVPPNSTVTIVHSGHKTPMFSNGAGKVTVDAGLLAAQHRYTVRSVQLADIVAPIKRVPTGLITLNNGNRVDGLWFSTMHWFVSGDTAMKRVPVIDPRSTGDSLVHTTYISLERCIGKITEYCKRMAAQHPDVERIYVWSSRGLPQLTLDYFSQPASSQIRFSIFPNKQRTVAIVPRSDTLAELLANYHKRVPVGL